VMPSLSVSSVASAGCVTTVTSSKLIIIKYHYLSSSSMHYSVPDV
jgi:hypothetical protein